MEMKALIIVNYVCTFACTQTHSYVQVHKTYVSMYKYTYDAALERGGKLKRNI